MHLPSTTPLWSKVEVMSTVLSSGLVVRTQPSVLSPGCTAVNQVIWDTLESFRDRCITATTLYINDLPKSQRYNIARQEGRVTCPQVRSNGFAIAVIDEPRVGHHLQATFYVRGKRGCIHYGGIIETEDLGIVLPPIER
ncbi:MAG: hypothetical protein JWN75_962 [Candidatus Saccharibacteria bacterium]|nr:hypothetical protein [Candidatus Saccharibacteria bacterium]